MNKFEISRFNPCKESIEFRKQFPDFKSAWNNCPRGDWMLWIAKKLDVDLLKLTTAKALCANTVRHLMEDDRSTKAIDVALMFGQGKATIEELEIAADDAAAADDATYAADAAYAAADTAYAANAAAAAAYANDNANAKTQNQLQTADICRQVLTDVVFEAIDKLTA